MIFIFEGCGGVLASDGEDLCCGALYCRYAGGGAPTEGAAGCVENVVKWLLLGRSGCEKASGGGA